MGYEDSRAAVRDALRLSRAMTYKSAVAGLPLGGGKGVIMLRPDQPLSDARGATRCSTSPTLSTPSAGATSPPRTSARRPSDMATIRERTRHVAGLARDRGGSGDPSPFTALGVVTAIEVSCERVFGTTSLAGRSIAVAGLGHVGGDIARRLAAAGARWS